MARLDEHRGKQLLQAAGIALPRGDRAETPEQAARIAAELDGPCVVKALALVTGRAARGWVRMADTPDEAQAIAAELLAAPEVNAVRVEEKLAIRREFFAAALVDDRAGQPLVVLSSRGGSGIEQIAAEYPDSVARRHVDVRRGLEPYMGRQLAASVGLTGKLQVRCGTLLTQLYDAFTRFDCRSLEINPVVETEDGKLVAADCHAAIDDYAVFRQPSLGIRMAREIGHDPGERELIAWEVEKNDYRGTFFFIQLADATSGDNYVAFHGAGGGGSMMSMDALMKEGFQPANFCDTSGNPPASKVYRAAKVLLSMPGIVGYFASGSGVASQEQWQSAIGLIKAFRELGLTVPAVIRLGGNQEERAIELLQRHCAALDAPVEAYGKDDSARFCAQRLRQLVDGYQPPAKPSAPDPISADKLPPDAYHFRTMTGEIAIDQSRWTEETARAVADACPRGILKVVDAAEGRGEAMLRPDDATSQNQGRSMASPLRVVLAISEEDAAKGRCIECLACELKACELGVKAIRIDLPMPTQDAVAQAPVLAPGTSRGARATGSQEGGK